MNVLWPVVFASLLLLAGFVLRARLRVFQVTYMPGAIIGGLLGLAFIQACLAGPMLAEGRGLEVEATLHGFATMADGLASVLGSWPGLLIAVVFAGLLLERPEKQARQPGAGRGVVQAGVYAWIIIVGEIALGLLAVALVIGPVFGLPPLAGQLIEAGFAGGHGTSAGLAATYETLEVFESGRDLAFFMATAGLVWSVLSGIVLVNIGIRRGWTRGDAVLTPSTGLEPSRSPTAAALARVSGDALDPLVFQACLVAAALALGGLYQMAFSALASPGIIGEDAARYLGNVPLFLFALFGGWSIRHVMAVLGIDHLIDSASIKRVVGVAMEFLIVAAIASLRVEVIGENLGALLVLCALGFGWAVFCLVWVARRVLPTSHWFELGLINYGMSTGTTAQGMMLLRTIDRDLDSGAAEDYALAAPMSAPFVGGGVITFVLPMVILGRGALMVGIVASVLLVALFSLGFWLRRASN